MDADGLAKASRSALVPLTVIGGRWAGARCALFRAPSPVAVHCRRFHAVRPFFAATFGIKSSATNSLGFREFLLAGLSALYLPACGGLFSLLERSDLPRDQLYRNLRKMLELRGPGKAPQGRLPERELYDRAFLSALRKARPHRRIASGRQKAASWRPLGGHWAIGEFHGYVIKSSPFHSFVACRQKAR